MKKTLIFVSILFLSAGFALAIPAQINYQGVLKDTAGNPISNPALSMVFSIYSGATGGTALWTETQSVTVEGGIYSVQMGSVTPIPASHFDGNAKYLGIQVGTDTEMTPRLILVSVPYAYRAAQTDAATSAITAEGAANADNATKAGNYPVAKTGSGDFVTVTTGGKLDSSLIPTTGVQVESADKVDGLHASATPTANYLYPLSGDGIFQLTANKTSVISGESSSTTNNASALVGRISSASPGGYSAGVRGINEGTLGNGIGVWGSQAGGGWGVYGTAITGRGVYGYATGAGGFGVYGNASDTSGTVNYGGFFTTAGSSGIAVKGTATQTTGNSYGGYFDSQSPSGAGVYGLHAATTGTTPGVSGETNSQDPYAAGVVGRVTSTSPQTWSAGVRGINEGTDVNGIGVWGSQNGNGYGVYGTSAGSGATSRGVYGSGYGIGGYFDTLTSTNYSGYFTGGKGVKVIGTVEATYLKGDGSQLTGVASAAATTLNGYSAGNAAGQVPVSNGTLNSTLNADLLDGFNTAVYGTTIVPTTDGTGKLSANIIPTTGVTMENANMVDGYHAGNASGQVPVSNGTLNATLNVDLLDGFNTAVSGNTIIPTTDATGKLSANIIPTTGVTMENANMVDGYHAGNASGQIPVSNGTLNATLNADLLDGFNTAVSGNTIIPTTDASSGKLSANIIPTTGVTMENANMVDGIHANSTATTSNLYPLDASARFTLSSADTSFTIRGINSGNTGTAIYGKATGDYGVAVSGEALGTPGTAHNIGGYFASNGNSGDCYGVYGKATGVYGVGGYFEALGNLGDAKAVYGKAVDSSSVNYGGYFETLSSTGYSGYFTGGKGVKVVGTLEADSIKGGAANADTVDNIHANSTATANNLYPLDGVKRFDLNLGATNTDFAIRGINPSEIGINFVAAVSGEATGFLDDTENYGGYFVAAGGKGRAVYGIATNTTALTGPNYGGYFKTNGGNTDGGTYGAGVYGIATKTGNLQNFGGDFKANGDSGMGVRGIADAGAGTHYGGSFIGINGDGSGVQAQGTKYGVEASAGAGGVGVYSLASSGTAFRGFGDNYGVSVEASNPAGVGVYGLASDGGAGGSYGGRFISNSSSGVGVYGYANSTYGGVFGSSTNGYGVRGDSTNSYAGYFNGRLHVQGAISTRTQTKDAIYTLTATDSVIFANTAGGPFNITLPAGASDTIGRVYYIYNTGANQVSLEASGGDTINGTVSTAVQWKCIRVIGMNTNNWISNVF